MTACGRVGWAGDFAFEDDRLHHIVWVQRGDGGHERLGVRVQRLIEQFRGRRHFHQPPQIHHRHSITHMLDHAEIMSNEQIRETEFLLHIH